MRYILLSVLAMMLALSPSIEGAAQSQKPKKITRQTTTQNDASKKKAEQEAAKRRQQAAAEKKRQEEAARKQAEEQKRLEEQKRQLAEEQKRLEEEKRKQAEEQKRLEEVKRQQEEAARKQAEERARQEEQRRTFTVSGVQFTMVKVDGGTFQMGSNDGRDDEKPVHSVTLSDYYIGQTEVTQALWIAVMGSNPSRFKGDNLPVEQVSWNDCQTFINKLNELTGENFRLPTEAEWEFAAKGGNKSRGYTYSGSNELDDVAWYGGNSGRKTHPVGTKAPNELGIYDMSGNVWEWCQDRKGDYTSFAQTNPTGSVSGSFRVFRGGCWLNGATACRAANRSWHESTDARYYLGFRLALSNKLTEKQKRLEEERRQEELRRQQAAAANLVQVNGNRTFTVNGVQFTMVKVDGGTFQMGSNGGGADEKPVHNVTLSSYYIGQTEVTQALWTAVMGSNPSSNKGDNLPVESVSWNDCQEFIIKLNELTGEKFRLPTEAEWEFAARGGNQSRGYKYSGSNEIDDIAWYEDNSYDETHPVGTKAPNELGIYDMSGNVWEWCQDWYGKYSSSAQTNPTGPASGSFRVFRGGSWIFNASGSRAACRGCSRPSATFYTLGLRLAL